MRAKPLYFALGVFAVVSLLAQAAFAGEHCPLDENVVCASQNCIHTWGDDGRPLGPVYYDLFGSELGKASWHSVEHKGKGLPATCALKGEVTNINEVYDLAKPHSQIVITTSGGASCTGADPVRYDHCSPVNFSLTCTFSGTSSSVRFTGNDSAVISLTGCCCDGSDTQCCSVTPQQAR